LRGYPPCIFREVIAKKKYQISGVELDRLKILSDVLNGKLTLKEASHALHLSYRQALEAKKVEEVVREGVKQERWKQVESILLGVVLD
jgi:uridylate kinase